MRAQFWYASESDYTRGKLRAGIAQGLWQQVCGEVYRDGPSKPTPLEYAFGLVLLTRGVASDELAGVLLELDSVRLTPSGHVASAPRSGRKRVRRRVIAEDRVMIVADFPCTNGLQTLIDLAAVVSDDVWEQALESALRQKHVTVEQLEAALPELTRSRVPGTPLIRRVLARRPAGAAPTESVLETLMVQLARQIPGLPPPQRQVRIVNRNGRFVARVDLCWPELEIFLELDGSQHKGQPVHDAVRELDVVIATGWVPGRFTWTEVVDHPVHTRRRLIALVESQRRKLARIA
jgi:very-short-patch-repair endonuclease